MTPEQLMALAQNVDPAQVAQIAAQLGIDPKAAGQIIERAMPGARPLPFGHFGDGNIHYNVSQPVGMDKDAFARRWWDISGPLYELVRSLGGSISAEHGIGRLKRDQLVTVKSPIEIEMMRQIKRTLDPQGILNPRKTV